MKPSLGKAIAGGFLGTVVMTMMMYFAAPMMGIPKMDIAAALGVMLGLGWLGGLMMHFINGSLIFPLTYTNTLYRWLPGAPVVKGSLWGLGLWLVAQTMVMPMTGAGFFSARSGGVMAVMGSLVGHLLYGALLGAIAGTAACRISHGEPETHAI